ncbi:glycosyltransferase [Arthrobacter sp. VKM Ac-2550]|uniref:glycosyltransferase n=1 Tax=Crystallibacter permensis TaxID=1938888 RepID=UPI00222637A1|nr:glycosyltransferase family 4 protein [Arthrobacter sp. VKM Ac-2550]MCW2131645.1 Glycosyl transferases group 1 [Arthrobacter sp. VKM Ac-2550]
MRLLYVAESVPNRDPVRGDGSSMIPYEVIRNLPSDVAVTLLTYSGSVELPDEVRSRCEAVHVLTPRAQRAAILHSLASRFDVGACERATLEAVSTATRLSRQCDATLMHGPHVLFLANHLYGPMALQTVDPWSKRLRMDSGMVGGWRSYYRRFKSVAVLQTERRLPERARLLTVGAQDAAEWTEALNRPVRSIPNGVEHTAHTGRKGNSRTVCFVGSLNYGPNIDSVQVLIGKIAPRVWQRVPEAKFVIAGRQPTPEVLSLATERVQILANVPSVTDIFHSADVAVFPDEHGVGIRNSVREALAAGLPVVASPVAAREQDAHPLLTVEEDQQALVDHIVHRLTNDRMPTADGLSEAATRTWQTVAQEYLEELDNALRA